ncbi:MAG: hypothetical protein MK212_15165 [Saprospiraceae bacterium]|nr:hypothetical protein [Saprospiraceae bacterium]
MFDTYRKKVIALLIGSLFFLGVAYQFSIADTLAQKSQYEQSQARLASAQNIQQETQKYQKLLADLGSGSRVAFSQENLFDRVGKFCAQKSLGIVEMAAASRFQEQNYTLIQNKIVAKGEYIALVELVNALEKKWRFGKVVSTHFEKQRNAETRAWELVATIHLQNLQTSN